MHGIANVAIETNRLHKRGNNIYLIKNFKIRNHDKFKKRISRNSKKQNLHLEREKTL